MIWDGKADFTVLVLPETFSDFLPVQEIRSSHEAKSKWPHSDWFGAFVWCDILTVTYQVNKSLQSHSVQTGIAVRLIDSADSSFPQLQELWMLLMFRQLPELKEQKAQKH